MIRDLFSTIYRIALTESKVRARRIGSLMVILAGAAIVWAMIPDPASGTALLVVKAARAKYSSMTLALGAATLIGLLFSLAGFYLVRGRVADDIRTRMGSVIAATPVSNTGFLIGRWLGNVLFLSALALSCMATTLVLHIMRGEAPIEMTTYLSIWGLMIGPLILFTACMALLFDSVPRLMGKLGDVLWFFVWIWMVAQIDENLPTLIGGWLPRDWIDFPGFRLIGREIAGLVGHHHFALGISDFDASLPLLDWTHHTWAWSVICERLISAGLALLPLPLAIVLFHRFSPDRVKAKHAARRRSPLAVLNAMTAPLARFVRPLLALSTRLPGRAGQTLADVSLTLMLFPLGLVALIGCNLAGALSPASAIGAVVLVAGACWGVLIADLSVRDHQADLGAMTAAVPGGQLSGMVRQMMAAVLLAVAMNAVVLLKWLVLDPGRAGMLLAGILGLSGLMLMFGRLTRTSRLFLGLFLFWVYIASNAPRVAEIDFLAVNGAANVQTAITGLMAAVLSLAIAIGWVRSRQ
ncbi:hypothetical protein KSF73_05085 [Burkholderiaceae bacterium DAT-1]|nr:hypothetical protein [Burkholderiaceae bacterium DAT-1]